MDHRDIRSTSALGLYLRTLWWEKNMFWGWIEPVPLVIFVDMADSFAHGHFKQGVIRRPDDGGKKREKRTLGREIPWG